jgi:signal transduction histidine kinase
VTPRRLHLSIAFVAAALLLAMGLLAYLMRQQDQAFEAADWVAQALDVRARLQQLQATIEDGPEHAPRALAILSGLRERVANRKATLDRLDAIATDLGFGREGVQLRVAALIGEESDLLLERRGKLAAESREARLALAVGGGLVVVLLAAAFTMVVRDNRQRRAAEEELRRSNLSLEQRVAERTAEQREAEARMRELSRRLLVVQEEERRALARELHDEVGQQLGAIKLNLKALAATARDPTRIEDGLAIVDATIAHIRDRALELRPALLDDLGLAAALEWLCRQQAQRSGTSIQFQASPLPALPAELATALYRIAQEGITNALKHASASAIGVSLRTDGNRLDVEVADNGKGFDPATAAAGIGLPGMRERASSLGGALGIDSKPGLGTKLFARFPLSNDD